ncbi:MAG TPA: CHRD domain-containing protein [Allosphingosinicella sp.]|nr:CHRD domain-containing protein [Allosphingosinicella sp.]
MIATNKFRAALLSSLGSLALAGCATVEEAAVQAVSTTHHATLTGAEVVTSPGDPDGYARAQLSISNELNQICYDVGDIRNLAPITSLTINRGRRGQVGPAVLRITRANEGVWKNCVGRAEWLERTLEYAPGAFYIQISTTEFPNGAIRGQFHD